MKALSGAGLTSLVAMITAIAGCKVLDGWNELPYYETPGFTESETYDPPPNVSAVPPPPISGGTLLVTADKALAIAADPDRDRIAIVDLGTFEVDAILPLEKDDEPGRVAEGAAGSVHVALRRGGAVITIDLATREMHRRPVCPAPRGIAYDASTDLLHVACAGGELVTLSSDVTAPPVRELRLDRDLRDVVVEGDSLLVSRFRSAELLVVAKDGTVAERIRPLAYIPGELYGDESDTRAFEPAVAWRTVPLPGGGVAMVHQRAIITPVDAVGAGRYYSKDCRRRLIHTAVTVTRPLPSEGHPWEPLLSRHGVGIIGVGLLPVDIAVSPDGLSAAIVQAGSRDVVETPLETLEREDGIETCALAPDQRRLFVGSSGEPIAVGYDGERNLLVQVREPPSILRFGALSGEKLGTLELPGESRLDDSHALFHGDRGGALSVTCASCHPEGHEDGRVWNFQPTGPRRTQSVAGGVLATMPLHWDGGLVDFRGFMEEVLEKRMGGSLPDRERLDAFAEWLDTIKALPRSKPADEDAVERGKWLLYDPTLGCTTCHSGRKLTNNETVDVGTGQPFQVPSLHGLAARAPYMHDGCAATLHDRFGPCGGGDRHGVTSALTPAQIDDLVAYLETL
ncbi:cytochrome-c peroxidase [Sorangium sp. So ce204]|uniref:cytochrome-c peroxidase n=1 Tax=Sorangium sp. So ce204 TaxID=3133288 RepID=UPI003F62D25A